LNAVFAAGALAAIGFAVTRAMTRTRSTEIGNHGLRESLASPPHDAAPRLSRVTPVLLDLSDVFDARQVEDAEAMDRAGAEFDLDSATARASERVPPMVSGDDMEALAPEDLGRGWLSQATQAEYSVTEAELFDVENLPAPEADAEELLEDDSLLRV